MLSIHDVLRGSSVKRVDFNKLTMSDKWRDSRAIAADFYEIRRQDEVVQRICYKVFKACNHNKVEKLERYFTNFGRNQFRIIDRVPLAYCLNSDTETRVRNILNVYRIRFHLDAII